MSTETMVMDDVYKRALTYVYDIEPQETKTLDFTFDHTAPQGVLEISCHYGGHYEAGMHQAITVTAPQGTSVAQYPNNGIPLDANPSPGGGPISGSKCDPPVVVTIASGAFAPTSLTLNMGDTLTVTNKGNDSYTLTATPDAGTRFTSVDPQETEYVTFPKAGTFTLSTQEHPEIKATVTVSSTAGVTCGASSVATVSFDANFTNIEHPYFITPTKLTIQADESITLSNLSDRSLTFTSTPDAQLGDIQLDRNEHQLLNFRDSGTYVISCKEFPTQSFTVVVQGSGDNT
jgi:plastocyanin